MMAAIREMLVESYVLTKDMIVAHWRLLLLMWIGSVLIAFNVGYFG